MKLRRRRPLGVLCAVLAAAAGAIGTPAVAALTAAPAAAATTVGCIATPKDFAYAFLQAIPEPTTTSNLTAILAWEDAEGGNWKNTAKFNPLNTTWVYDGSVPFNGDPTSNNGYPVQAYSSWADGLHATVNTITENSGRTYAGILGALAQGTNAQAVTDAVDASPWGTTNATSFIPYANSYNPPPPSWQPLCMSLWAGSALYGGQSVTSPSGQYTLTMQTDGNLVESMQGRPIWSTGTGGNPGALLAMQHDGNLVIYSADYRPLWGSGTSAPGGNFVLDMQDDGDAVVYSPSSAIWANHAPTWRLDTGATLQVGQELLSSDRRYVLVMQGDGNLVEYDGATPIWGTGTHASRAWAVMQSDGNLVVYNAYGQPLWASGTGGHSGYFAAILQTDGNLVIYAPTFALWGNGA